ncbi:T6SS immunity protein Tdi1 domain-containing protein [Jannaschia sp. LMIT008]|uniref:T6SS immunity protein Tdi1 domain-containing protein n=1 Tax=Jannaschia maritima TaxID=3032585 RepID=UPI002811B1B9|nr:T6SS immunity protein Tdi1 domain-containing protein [Jannaschia sp. LMIT008]
MSREFDDRYGAQNRDILETRTVDELRSVAGGRVIGDGIYRVLDDDAVGMIGPSIDTMFPDRAGALDPFATDWLGRVFATRADRVGTVAILEPGTAEVLDTGIDLAAFHRTEIVEQADAALAVDFYGAWRDGGGAVPAADQCVGYRRPLFLGGGDDVENLELGDMDVYWSVMAQTVEQIRRRTA